MCAKLNNPVAAAKTYWSTISRFLNKRKMPGITPVLSNGKMISNFRIKTELFSSFHFSFCSVFQSKVQVHYQTLFIGLINV